jgi:hypothetical protein
MILQLTEPSTLLACCLVSPCLRVISRRCLYSTVTLKTTAQVETWCRTVSANKDLRFTCSLTLPGHYAGIEIRILRVRQHLALVLQLCNRIQHLSIIFASSVGQVLFQPWMFPQPKPQLHVALVHSPNHMDPTQDPFGTFLKIKPDSFEVKMIGFPAPRPPDHYLRTILRHACDLEQLRFSGFFAMKVGFHAKKLIKS